MKFEQPFWFLLLILIPLIILLRLRYRKGVIYPSLESLPEGRSLRTRLIFLRDLPYYCAFVLMIIAAAGPYRVLGETTDYSKGILLQLVIDRSGSMGSLMDKKGETNRLDIVKDVVGEFIGGEGSDLPGRGSDRIGLISFALYADTMAPLTVSHDIIMELVEGLELAEESEDGTSLGDALALAVARIAAYRQKADVPEAGSVIILLTDGRNNSGNSDPLKAAEMAADFGIRIHTIGFGGGYYRNAFGIIRKIPPEHGIDETTLKEVAQISGGQYFNAGDENSLKEVYKRIDELEQAEMEELRSSEKELYFPRFLLIALILLAAGVFIRSMILNIVEDEK